jgi:hypothetical protein
LGDALEVFEFLNAEQTEEQSSQSFYLRSLLLRVLCVLNFQKNQSANISDLKFNIQNWQKAVVCVLSVDRLTERSMFKVQSSRLAAGIW